MPTTYNPNIPQATDQISTSQGDLLENFTQLNDQFAVDHTAFYTGSDNGDGYHKRISFPNVQAVDPALPNPGTAVTSIIYTKTVSGTSQLFFRNSDEVQQISNGAPIKVQVLINGTAGGILGTAINVTNGNVVRTGAGQYTVTFTTALSTTTYKYLLSTEGGSSNVFAQVKNGTRAAGSIQIQCLDPSDNLRDAASVSLTIWE